MRGHGSVAAFALARGKIWHEADERSVGKRRQLSGSKQTSKARRHDRSGFPSIATRPLFRDSFAYANGLRGELLDATATGSAGGYRLRRSCHAGVNFSTGRVRGNATRPIAYRLLHWPGTYREPESEHRSQQGTDTGQCRTAAGHDRYFHVSLSRALRREACRDASLLQVLPSARPFSIAVPAQLQTTLNAHTFNSAT